MLANARPAGKIALAHPWGIHCLQGKVRSGCAGTQGVGREEVTEMFTTPYFRAAWPGSLRYFALFVLVCLSRASLALPDDLSAPARVDLYGDPLPAGAISRLGTLRFRLPGIATTATFSPDGKLLAVGGWFKGVVGMDVANGKTVSRLGAGSVAGADRIAFSADGRIAAFSGVDFVMHVWDIRNGTEILKFSVLGSAEPGHAFGAQRGWPLAVSATGRYLMCVCPDGVLRVWRLEPGNVDSVYEERIRTDHARQYATALFTRDELSLIVASGSDSAIRLVDIKSGREVRRFAGHIGTIAGIALSPNGEALASVGEDRSLREWKIAEATVLWKVETPYGNDHASLVGFTADGTRIFTAVGEEAAKYDFWNPANGKPAGSFEFKVSHRVCAVSPDLTAAIPATSMSQPSITILNTVPSKAGELFNGHNKGIERVTFSPDSRYVASEGWDGVRVWEPTTGKQLWSVPYRARCAFSRDGKAIYLGTDEISVRDPQVGTVQRRFRVVEDFDAVNDMAVSAEGAKVVVGLGGRLGVFELAGGKKLWRWAIDTSGERGLWVGYPSRGHSVIAASLGSPGRIDLYDEDNGKRVGGISSDPLLCVRLSHDGKAIFATSVGANLSWSYPELRPVLNVSNLSGRTEGAATISDDCKITAACSQSGEIVFHKLETGERIGALPDAVGPGVSAIAISPDNAMLAAAYADTSIIVWAVPEAVRNAAKPATR